MASAAWDVQYALALALGEPEKVHLEGIIAANFGETGVRERHRRILPGNSTARSSGSTTLRTSRYFSCSAKPCGRFRILTTIRRNQSQPATSKSFPAPHRATLVPFSRFKLTAFQAVSFQQFFLVLGFLLSVF
jgi:hypothetical protein